MVISGAGSTLLALINTSHTIDVVAAITTAWKNIGVAAQVRALHTDNNGAVAQITWVEILSALAGHQRDFMRTCLTFDAPAIT